MLQHISVAVNPDLILKGDVIIIKRTYFDPSAPMRLVTKCTRCAGTFPTELRRMQSLDSYGKRRCEVRNIPQCPPCRSRYPKKCPSYLGIPITDPSRLLPAHCGAQP
jgi:hypothetical protein